jgi:hypothetical protein
MVFELKGYLQRRQGKQEEGLRSLEHAIDLDPRNFFTLLQIALSYDFLRAILTKQSCWSGRWPSNRTTLM